MIGQAEIIVGAEVNYPSAVGDRDFGVLRPGDDSFRFEKPLCFNFLEGLGDMVGKFREHRAISRKARAMQSAAHACAREECVSARP